MGNSGSTNTTKTASSSQLQTPKDNFNDLIKKEFAKVVENLFSKNPTIYISQLGQFHQLALEEVKKSLKLSLSLQDIQRVVLPEWNDFTRCIAESDNLIVDQEAEIMQHVFTPNQHHHIEMKIVPMVAWRNAMRLSIRHSVSIAIAKNRMYQSAEKIRLLFAALARIKEVDLNQPCGYLSDTALAHIRMKAIAEFTVREYGNLALSALDNVLNNFIIENDYRRHQTELLIGEAVRFAVEEYRKAMDQILEKGSRSRNFLIAIHQQLLTITMDSFKSSYYPWQTHFAEKTAGNIQAQLELQLPQVLETNYISCVAANIRRNEAHSVAFEAFKNSRSTDHDQVMRTGQTQAAEAERSDLEVFLEKAAAEQPWVRQQWFNELFERIRLEATAAAGTSAESNNTKRKTTRQETTAVPDGNNKVLPFEEPGSREEPTSVPTSDVAPMEADPKNDTTRNDLEYLINEVADLLANSNGTSRIVRLKATRCLNEARQVLEDQDTSETQLNLKREQLEVWKNSLMK